MWEWPKMLGEFMQVEVINVKPSCRGGKCGNKWFRWIKCAISLVVAEAGFINCKFENYFAMRVMYHKLNFVDMFVSCTFKHLPILAARFVSFALINGTIWELCMWEVNCESFRNHALEKCTNM